MAIFKNGPNGSFSGKVGSVVGYKWKGIDVIRGLPRKSHRPRSEARLANEQAMKLIMGALKSLKVFIRTGFREAAEPLNMTAFNLALSVNKKQAIKGEYPNLEIDWTRFKVSQGDLPGPEQATVNWTDNGLHITWEDNTGTNQAYGSDNLSILIYVHNKDSWVPFLNEATRDAGECAVPAQGSWMGREVEVYLSFISFGGELVSDSIHLHVPAMDT